MNLETRVETLEHELKILKSEIEATLLEIQEQVLIHYYPTLRAEDSTPPQDISKHGSHRARSQKEQSPEPAMSTSATDKRVGTAAVLTREVALDTKRNGAQDASSFSRQEMNGSAGSLAPSMLPKLTVWSNSAVKQIGSEEAAQLVESCTEEVGCTPAIKMFLLQLIDSYDSDEPPSHADTATLMHVFLELNTILGAAKGRQAQNSTQNALIEVESHG